MLDLSIVLCVLGIKDHDVKMLMAPNGREGLKMENNKSNMVCNSTVKNITMVNIYQIDI